MNFSYSRMYDNSRQRAPRMQMGIQPFMGQQPQAQPPMSAPMQAPQANYSAIAQQMGPAAPTEPRMAYTPRMPGRGMAA